MVAKNSDKEQKINQLKDILENKILKNDINLNDVAIEYENTDRIYEIALTRLSDMYIDENKEKKAIKMVHDFTSTSNKKNISRITVEYSAFFSLIIFYRHQFDNYKLDTLWSEENTKKFCHFKSFNHLRILYILYNVNKIESITDINFYLELAQNNILETEGKNPGFNHAIGDLYACFCEKFENSDLLKQIMDNWGSIAKKYTYKAIKLEPKTAVFNCTYGRILSISGKFEEAENHFKIAIAKEKSSRPDYSLQIGKYNYYRNYNQIRILAKRIQDQMDMVDSMRDSLTSNIQTIGIFSGIMSFVIGSIQLANRNSAVESGMLILTLMGVLVAALSTFSLLLHLGRKKLSSLITMIVIIVLSVVFSILMVFKLNSIEVPNNTSNNNSSITSGDINNA